MTASPIDFTSLDRAALLKLNNDHAVELSFASAEQFAELTDKAFYLRGFAPARGFLMAFDQDADISGPNYAWFKARYERFVYIGRVVIAADGRRHGLARALYGDLLAEARSVGHSVVGCEINSDPPNPTSDAFHAKLGFATAGTARLADRAKTVRYLIRTLP
jgi:predicted GNAT superfamily acetyltransferase